MRQFYGLLSRAIFAGIFLASVVGSSSAYAETYRAGQFTVTDTTDGYRVCKSNGKCVSLNTSNFLIRGRDDGYRWSRWDVGKYFYGISYAEGDTSSKEMNFSFGSTGKTEKLIFKGRLTPVAQRAEQVEISWATTCYVTNIQSGQLAIRKSPEGRSLAGLDNGNSVLLKKKQGNWNYVKVVQGSSSEITNLSGWVNSKYLTCDAPEPID